MLGDGDGVGDEVAPGTCDADCPVSDEVADGITDGSALGDWAATELASDVAVSPVTLADEVGGARLGAETAGRNIRKSPATNTTAASERVAMAQVGSRRPFGRPTHGRAVDLWTTPSVWATL